MFPVFPQTPSFFIMKTVTLSLFFTFFSAFSVFAGPTSLTGNQTEDVVTITRNPQVALKGTYKVPDGKKLVFEAGAQLAADRASKIVIAGELVISGNEKIPVLFRGRAWDGIIVEETGKADINGLQITGTSIALEMSGKMSALKNSVFFKNTCGVLLQGKDSSEIDNVLFLQNDEYGIMISEQGATFKNCSFLKNKGYGVQIYQASPAFERVYFSDNGKAGLFAMEAGTSGKQCHFDEKGIALESKVSEGELKFHECFWGPRATAQMQSKGAGIGLKHVKDGNNGGGQAKADKKDFLKTPPKQCGATVTSKI